MHYSVINSFFYWKLVIMLLLCTSNIVIAPIAGHDFLVISESSGPYERSFHYLDERALYFQWPLLSLRLILNDRSRYAYIVHWSIFLCVSSHSLAPFTLATSHSFSWVVLMMVHFPILVNYTIARCCRTRASIIMHAIINLHTSRRRLLFFKDCAL